VSAAEEINKALQGGLADPNRVVVSGVLPTNSYQVLYDGEYQDHIVPLLEGLQAVIFVAA